MKFKILRKPNVGSFCPAIISSVITFKSNFCSPLFKVAPKVRKVMIESKEGRDPTMEIPGTDEEETNDQKLLKLFKNLEQEWDFINKRPERTMYRSSTGLSKMVTLGLVYNSPGKLMSSLQHRISPSEKVAWKVRTNDLAVEEILNERRAAIESGKFKGRRLFEEVEGGNEVGFERDELTCNGLEIGLVQESEVRSVFSYESDNYEDESWGRKEVLSPPCPHCSSSSSSSSQCAENMQREGTEVTTLTQKRTAIDVAGSGRLRWTVIMVWLAITLVLCIVGIISSRSFGVYEDEEIILTPT